MAEENNPKWYVRLLLRALRSPVNTVFAAALLYYGFLGFVLENNPLVDKLIFFVVIGLWMFWLLAKNLFKIILLAVVIAMAGYGYYAYTHKDIAECEVSGGEWNKETKTCEAKLSWWQKAMQMWEDYVTPEHNQPEKKEKAPQK